jgi:hypothetical protein
LHILPVKQKAEIKMKTERTILPNANPFHMKMRFKRYNKKQTIGVKN